MRKSGGAAIHMQQNSTENQISFLVADESFLENCPSTPVKTPFDKDVLDYLDCVSKKLLSSPASKLYPDVITFAFWIRRASINTYKNAIVSKEGQRVVGRGVVFHVAPSNVAVNFAYSLVSGLLAGNINIVRVPSKQFPQVNIIASAIVTASNVTDRKYLQYVTAVCDTMRLPPIVDKAIEPRGTIIKSFRNRN